MVKCERSYPIDDDLGRNTIAYRVAPVELGRGGMCFGRTYPVEMHFLSTIQYRVARASLVLYADNDDDDEPTYPGA